MGWTFIKYRDFKIIQYVSVGVFIETQDKEETSREGRGPDMSFFNYPGENRFQLT